MQSEVDSPALDISVVICTWNRAKLLRQTLASFCHLSVPEGVGWEVLIVNNNCTDQTSDVVAEFLPELPVREIIEPTPGKSHALNTGAQAARGRIIIWTDDDVLVRPDWLTAYHEAFTKYPESQFWGGPVEPWFEEPPPAWLNASWPVVQHAYAVIDYTDEEIPISEKTLPFGVNWAICRETQLAYLYDPRLGPRPASTLRGEETTLVRQLLANGVSGRWIPNARMQHFIPQDRMTYRYLRGFYYGQGEGFARISKLGLRQLNTKSQTRLLATFVKHRFLSDLYWLFGKYRKSARHLVAAQMSLGSWREMRRGAASIQDTTALEKR